MNKRDFLLTSASAALASAAVVSTDAAASSPDATVASSTSGATPSVLGRTQRLPDLAVPRAERFESYVGETFETAGATLRLASVRRLPEVPGHHQFSVRFEAVEGALPAAGLRELRHATGQRLALHLERADAALDAHFSLLV